MIDVHCHLNFVKFENDYDQVITDAKEAGVHTIINTGTKIDSSQWAVELAEKYSNLYAIVGVHPHHADKVTEGHPEQSEGSPNQQDTDSIASLQNNTMVNWMEQLDKLAKHPKVIGIGECGMDYYSYQSNGIVDAKLQKEVFEKQIELAYRLKLPLQI